MKFTTSGWQRWLTFLEALFTQTAFFNYWSEIMLISFTKSNWKYSKGQPVTRKTEGFRGALNHKCRKPTCIYSKHLQLVNLVKKEIYTVLLKISKLHNAHFPFVAWLHAIKGNTELRQLRKKQTSLRIPLTSLSSNFNVFQIKLK